MWVLLSSQTTVKKFGPYRVGYTFKVMQLKVFVLSHPIYKNFCMSFPSPYLHNNLQHQMGVGGPKGTHLDLDKAHS